MRCTAIVVVLLAGYSAGQEPVASTETMIDQDVVLIRELSARKNSIDLEKKLIELSKKYESYQP